MLGISETFSTSPAVSVEVKPSRASRSAGASQHVVARIGPGGVQRSPAVHVVGNEMPALRGNNKSRIMRMATNDAALDIALDRMIDAVLGRSHR